MNFYDIRLSAEDLAVLGAALDAMPHGRVAKVVAYMQGQISEQERAAAENQRAEREARIAGFREEGRQQERAEFATASAAPKGD